MPMNWQTIQLPIAAGLSQKSDARASNPPFLDRAVDIEFDETGGVQTRKPFTSFTTNILGGGSLLNIRKLFVQGGELCAFTDTALYTYSPYLVKWVLRATHLACEVSETTHFATMGDAHDCDRAELNGTIVFTWTGDGGNTWAAAIDRASGSVLMQPTALGFTGPIRVIAAATKILMFVTSGGNLRVMAIDPASPATAIGVGTTTLVLNSATFNAVFDVCKRPGVDVVCVVAREFVATSYFVATIDSTGATVASATKVRPCDSTLTVACDPTGTYYQVVRINGTAAGALIGDTLLASNLSDQTINSALPHTNAIGAAGVQVTAVYRLVTNGGFYRCYYFANFSNGALDAGNLSSGWVDTNGSIVGATTDIAAGASMALGAKAFAQGSSAFVTVMFDGSISATATTRLALQNTYFTYRDDNTLIAKQCATRASGVSGLTAWCMPSVNLSNGVYLWNGTKRRVLALGDNNQGYGARTQCEVALRFDSNDARQTAQLGLTTYVAAGEVLQYDGVSLYEVGFHIYPWRLSSVAGSGAAAFAAGTYTWKPTYRWVNARGESERSTTASYASSTITINTAPCTGTTDKTVTTHKTGTQFSGKNISVEYWRTVVSPPTDAPFYRVTSLDPSTHGTANGYVENGTGDTWSDSMSDATLALQEANPETGAALESIAPPSATIIIAGHSRVFLAGVPDDSTRIWYSRLRSDGEIASFNDGLTVEIPSKTGAITALAVNEEQLVAFTSTAIYVLPGDGFDNAGGGANYGPPRIVSSDVGAVNADSIVYTPSGLLFKSQKGWYLLAGWSLKYIGAPVFNYDAETIVAIHVDESQHQMRALSASRLLVFDYLIGQWAEWSTVGVSAALWEGSYVVATSTSTIVSQAFDFTGINYGLDVETSWIKLADLQGAGRVRWLSVLGEYRSAHALRVRVARDYQTGLLVNAKAKTLSLSTAVKTNGLPWNATITTSDLTGDDSNRQVFAIYVKSGGGASSIVLHEGLVYDGSGFVATTFVVTSVLVTIGSTPVTVAALEAAINGGTTEIQVTTADPAPTKTLVVPSVPANSYVQLSGGVDATDATYISDDLWTVTPSVVGGPLQVRIGASFQRCESIKVRLTPVTKTVTTTQGVSYTAVTAPTGEALKLTGLGFEVGIDRGLFRNLPASQKA